MPGTSHDQLAAQWMVTRGFLKGRAFQGRNPGHLVGRAVHDSNPIIWFKDASFREADFSFPIHFVCLAPMIPTATLGKVLLCDRDRFAVDPAWKGFAKDSTFANPLPLELLPIVLSR